MKRIFTLLLLLLAYKNAIAQQKLHADLIINAKKVYTVDDDFGVKESIAIKDGNILDVGTREEIAKKYNGTETFDATESYIYPGFIDAHCHFSGYALDGYKLDLVGTISFAQVLEKTKEYEKNNALGWIYGRGWDQNDWEVKEYPVKDSLDKYFPDKPVILKRIDGHAILVNQKALDEAGINEETIIEGGIVEKKNGKLTGILIDNAMEPVEKIIPPLPEKEAVKYLKSMEQECYKNGLTGVVDCGVQKDVIEILKKLYQEKVLNINNTTLLSQDNETINTYITNGPFKINNLHVNSIKIYADGALGSRGACLLKDYHDMKGHKGMLLSSVKDMNELADKALQYDWQVCTHAIGDSANRTMLKLYATKLKNGNDKRWRIEHAQVVNPQDYHYFTDYNIIPSVQPTHAISDMPWAADRLGPKRVKHAYAYKDLLQTNGWLPLGTDFPVEAINPLATFYTAVVRKDKEGNPENGFQAENALSRVEALKGMTIWAAKSVFWEKEKGSIEQGKDADFVILDRDIINIKENKILNTKVLYTVQNGIFVH